MDKSSWIVRVGDLIRTIGPPSVRLVSAEVGAQFPISRTVLWDPLDQLPSVTDGLLLCLGVRADGDLLDVLTAAAGHGYRALAAKIGDAEPLVLEHLIRQADAVGVAVLGVDDVMEWLQLDRLLVGALDGSRQHSGPAQPALAVGDLFALANAIALATGAAVAVEDLQQRVLAYSTVPGQPIDDERREGILGRRVPELAENEWQYRAVHTSSEAVAFEPTDTGLGRLACSVRAGAHAIGSIWLVDPGGGFSDEQHRLLQESCEVAALHVLRARSAEDVARYRRAHQVRALLEADDPSAAFGLGLNKGTPLWVVTVDVVEPDDVQAGAEADMDRLVDALSLALAARVPASGCAAVAGRAHAVLSHGSSRPPVQVVTDAVTAASRVLGRELRAGIGGPAASVSDARSARAEADAVCSLLATDPARPQVVAAEDVRDDLVLRQLAVGHTVADLSQVAAKLLELGGDLPMTVRVWCECLGDVSAAAKRLSVHPNTVRYRLGRARDLAGFDATKANLALLTWLGLEVDLVRSTQFTLSRSVPTESPVSRRMPSAPRRGQ